MNTTIIAHPTATLSVPPWETEGTYWDIDFDGKFIGYVLKVEIGPETFWVASGSPLELFFLSQEEAVDYVVTARTKHLQPRPSTPKPVTKKKISPAPVPAPAPDMSGYLAEALPGDNVLVTGPAGQKYLVTFGHKPTCTCPAGCRRKACKHLAFAKPFTGQSVKSSRFPYVLVMLRHNDSDYALKGIGLGGPSRTAWRVLDQRIQQEIGTIYCWTNEAGKADFSVKPLGSKQTTGIAARLGTALDDCIETIFCLREAEKWNGQMTRI